MAAAENERSPKTGDLELGRKIAARREELGMSRKDLAQAASLSYPYIAQIETGYRLPSARHQVALSRVLGVSLDELFGIAEELPNVSDQSTTSAARTRSALASRPRMSLADAIEIAALAIEGLPASSRLAALSNLQSRIMNGVADDLARQRS